MSSVGEWVAFSVIGVAILSFALATVFAQRTFHAVLFLAGALVSVAALFVSMEAPFAGVIQLLVYVGGIVTLFVFAVMFVAGDDEGDVLEEDMS